VIPFASCEEIANQNFGRKKKKKSERLIHDTSRTTMRFVFQDARRGRRASSSRGRIDSSHGEKEAPPKQGREAGAPFHHFS